MEKTLGGDRLGSGSRMKVRLHGYERSTHNLGYIWRSTMSAGTLVPFLNEVALPGDTFDIKLDCDIKTHPTIGPLFGTYKVQLDVFSTPIRLYHRELHNNKLGIGTNMKNIYLPQLELRGQDMAGIVDDFDNIQINPSSILSYLGIRGVGYTSGASRTRKFNGIPFLNYWDIYKNYFSNKQENIGAVIHTDNTALMTSTTSINYNPGSGTITKLPTTSITNTSAGMYFLLNQPAGQAQTPSQIIFQTNIGNKTILDLTNTYIPNPSFSNCTQIRMDFDYSKWGNITINGWRFLTAQDVIQIPPRVVTFPLPNLDTMREQILITQNVGSPFLINTTAATLPPYQYITEVGALASYQFSQEGLALKTYQSDLFNNWLSKDTHTMITNTSAISTASGSFTIDTLNLSKKVYNLLNRIMVSGGTYDDWLDAVYTHDRFTRVETPVYQGGLIKELVFQEVVSNSESISEDGSQPLGTLAGRGVLASKHKGGYIHVKVDEPSYIMGIVSLTPRLDYSQGNKWDVNLQTMDDFHKPAMDEIGFQDLITEQMAWWTTYWDQGSLTWKQQSAGKQPAWLNYMTNVNQTRGNFAIKNNEMFMTLNRRYEPFSTPTPGIRDLTTYIDPVKFNNIFASTAIDSQNFWVQIAVDIEARRKMSAKVMPNP